MNNKYQAVLDASALLAVIQDEKGAKAVQPILNSSIMSSVNVTEVLTILKKINVDSNAAVTYIKDILADIIDFDLDQAALAAKIWPETKQYGLSLGDRACLALSVKLDLPVYTADKAWTNLKLNHLEVKLIR